MSVVRGLARNPLNWLLVFVPLAAVLQASGAGAVWVLAISALAMVPLAGLIGESTEALAYHTGPRLGGLLNATLGNAAELIISVVAIREGLLELVKASITGSILGNLLFVLGLSMFLGGLRNREQSFDRKRASADSILLVLAVTALAIPSVFSQASDGIHSPEAVEYLSLGVAAVMLVLYVLGLIYSLRTPAGPLSRPSADPAVHATAWSIRIAMTVLVPTTIGVVGMSEILVRQIEPVITGLGVSEFFLGVILVPIVGNIAEHLVAVTVARKNQMSLAVEIAIGSSLQVALFVVPFLVFVSLAMGNPLSLVFNPFELITLIGAVLITAFVAGDGESNWLEGAELTALYLIVALAFYFLP